MEFMAQLIWEIMMFLLMVQRFFFPFIQTNMKLITMIQHQFHIVLKDTLTSVGSSHFWAC